MATNTTWMNLGNTMLNENKQSTKRLYSIE